MAEPRTRTKRVRLVAAAGAVVATTTRITALALANPAAALPASQATCTLNTLTISPATGWFPLTAARTVHMDRTGALKADVVADVGVDAAAEVRLGWSINYGSPLEGTFGPSNFANHTEFWESRATFGLIDVGAGTTTIQPFVQLSASAGKRAGLLHRCFSVEGSTS